jgi:hypothetical protein
MHGVSGPRTQAVKRVLSLADDKSMVADLLFLEHWQMHRSYDLGSTLRAAQIRRANPTLAAEIQAELAVVPSAGLSRSH